MGTRGLMAFVIDGDTKAGYVHSDAYPSGLGADVLEWLREQYEYDAVTLSYQRARYFAQRLVVVDDNTVPTTAQQYELRRFANQNVSSGKLDDWYVLLRETQGNPALTLEAGFMDGVTKIEPYRLGCGHEYLYVVDFDKKEFKASGYGHLLGSWSFDELPTKEDFIAKTEPEDED